MTSALARSLCPKEKLTSQQENRLYKAKSVVYNEYKSKKPPVFRRNESGGMKGNET